jgi:hypothetical protein
MGYINFNVHKPIPELFHAMLAIAQLLVICLQDTDQQTIMLVLWL